MPRILEPARLPLQLLVLAAGILLVIGSGGGGGGDTPQHSVVRLPGKTFGGTCTDKGMSVDPTADGGYIIAGLTCSAGAGGYDAWLIKTDAVGNVVKEKTIGGTGEDLGFSVQQTAEGGYVLTGVYNVVNLHVDPSFVVDLSGALFLRKMDANLDLEWETVIQDVSVGGSYYPYTFGYSVQQVSDGYVVAGATGTAGGGGEGLLIKVNAAGVVQWSNFIGGEYLSGVRQAGDGGYVVGLAASVAPGTLGKTTSAGAIQWGSLLTGTADAVWVAADGGFVVTGEASSYLYFAKVNASGTLLWEKTYGNGNQGRGRSVVQTADLGYIIAGQQGAAGTGVDVYLVKIDASGNLEWQKSYAGLGTDIGRAVRETQSGGYVIVGDTTSDSAGSSDVFLIRTDASGNAL